MSLNFLEVLWIMHIINFDPLVTNGEPIFLIILYWLYVKYMFELNLSWHPHNIFRLFLLWFSGFILVYTHTLTAYIRQPLQATSISGSWIIMNKTCYGRRCGELLVWRTLDMPIYKNRYFLTNQRILNLEWFCVNLYWSGRHLYTATDSLKEHHSWLGKRLICLSYGYM